MYASWQTKLIVGIFALVGIAALAYLSLSLGRVELFSNNGYVLYANFDNISGLKTGDQVEIAGVKVGKVIAIALKDYRAQVALRINEGVKVDSDAIASIKTSGIIGDKYVSISLGAGDKELGDGGVIRRTQSAFVLEDAIGQLINSSGSGSGSSSESGASKDHGKTSAPEGIQ
ncbi:MAG TPA: outer membrane lipid asymmetry maintenance protein MlaD [Candidatus Binataceae bacterium]|jgi:phospholipid/cholesterol/gamma-HCH transport system substrate-binding protein|nr:outer membrane lipid asymmetry maintenance protein MlaD [Candidatus Binataceae bacterium]